MPQHDYKVSWVGDSAFAAWGATGTCLDANCSRSLAHKVGRCTEIWGGREIYGDMGRSQRRAHQVGPDGRAGEQPRFTNVSANLVHELGIYQKQSSFWFQAVTTQT